MPTPDTPAPEGGRPTTSSTPQAAESPVKSETSVGQFSAGFLHLLLDPRGLQALMLAGGGLLVLGLVLWLAVKGVFDDPINAAIGLGAANFTLLGGGVWLAAKTHYRIAGRGITMLACLLLPLNLWFYDAQGLVTLNDGGHLWLPALVCCVVYAGVARLLKDSLFVYAFAAGVALTGLLFLADDGVARFWEVLAPSTLLVVLGVLSIHAERLFPVTARRDADRAFTRGDFGRAFFRAGQTLLASGLGVLLAGRLAGRFYDNVFADLRWFEQPDVATVMNVKLAAFALSLTGAYSYAYSRFTAKRDGRYLLFAALSLAWSGLIGLDLLGVAFTEVVLVGLLATLAIACRVAEPVFARNEEAPRDEDVVERRGASAAEAFAGVAPVAAASALGLSLGQVLRGVWFSKVQPIGFEFTPGSAFTSLLVAAAALLGVAASARRGDDEPPSRFCVAGLAIVAFVANAAAVLIGVGAPLHAFGVASPGASGAWLLVVALVPLTGAVAAFVHKASSRRRAALTNATEACLWTVALLLAPHAALTPTGLTLATTLLLAVSFGMTARGEHRRHALVVVALLLAASGWQAVAVYQVSVRLLLLGLTAFSMAILALERLGVLLGMGNLGRAGVVLAATAGGLLAGNRLLAGETDWPLLALLAGQAAMTWFAVCLTPKAEGRRGLVVLGGVQTLATAVVLNALSELTIGQRMELLGTVAGGAMLTAGVLGWRREAVAAAPDRDSFTDVNLWVGSLLATVPMTVSLLGTR